MHDHQDKSEGRENLVNLSQGFFQRRHIVGRQTTRHRQQHGGQQGRDHRAAGRVVAEISPGRAVSSGP